MPSESAKTSILETVDCFNSKRLKCDHSDPLSRETIKKPEEIIICEKQEKLYCGRHALRALCQRLDLFSDGYLAEVARNLAALEQISRQGQTIQLKDYYDANTLEPNPSSMQNVIVLNIQSVQALLIQQDYHYHYLRRFRSTLNYFFQIDSQNPTYHQRIHSHNILNHLSILLENRANVYVAIKCSGDSIEQQLCARDIDARLWPFPNATADTEQLLSSF